jgi:Tfp pilus assembly protein PilF
MKNKILFLSIILLMSINVFAQSNKVLDAYNYLKAGKLDKAKAAIDAAALYPDTKDDPKTWLYKGNVYLAIAIKQSDPNNPYKNLAVNPLDTALEAYKRCLTLDPNYVAPAASPNSARVGLKLVADEYFNKGANYFNNKDFNTALNYFEKTRSIRKIYTNTPDTMANFYGAIAALNLQDTVTAEKYLKEIIVLQDYNNPTAFNLLFDIYLAKRDAANMLKTVELAKKRFPNNNDVLLREINYYLITGDLEKSQALLQEALTKDPNNYMLYYVIGTNYDQLSQDTSLTQERRDLFFEEAKKAYQKAIELKNDFYEAYYNYGALLFNKGVEIFNKANALPPNAQAEYENLKKVYEALWHQALPLLEKALELQPNDLPTLYTLRTIYARLSMPDKLTEVNQKIDSLKN